MTRETPDDSRLALIKGILFFVCLQPLAWLAWQYQNGHLGDDPIQGLQAGTGTWALNFLLLSLCISPARAYTGQHWLLRLRRMLGLFAFFYALLHFLTYTVVDHALDINAIARDVVRHPYVLVGFAAFVLLVPLALTSNALAIRRLGGRKWQELHRNVYLIAILAVIHRLWQSDFASLPGGLGYTVLLGMLLWWRIRERKRRASPVLPAGTQTIQFHRHRPDRKQ